MFGLSTQILIFDDESDNNWNRQKVAERLAQAELPSGLEPEIGADFSPVGEIYFYTLRTTNPRYDLMDLKTLDDWVVHKQFLLGTQRRRGGRHRRHHQGIPGADRSR